MIFNITPSIFNSSWSQSSFIVNLSDKRDTFIITSRISVKLIFFLRNNLKEFFSQ